MDPVTTTAVAPNSSSTMVKPIAAGCVVMSMTSRYPVVVRVIVVM